MTKLYKLRIAQRTLAKKVQLNYIAICSARRVIYVVRAIEIAIAAANCKSNLDGSTAAITALLI